MTRMNISNFVFVLILVLEQQQGVLPESTWIENTNDGGDTVIVSEEGKVLVEWIRSNNGYYDDRMVIGTKTTTSSSDNSSSQTSYRGIFAAADIEEGESLCFVPWNTIITGQKARQQQEEDHEEEEVSYDAYFPDTVFNLLHEMELGDDSHFAPYLQIMRSQRLSVPDSWSLSGREYFQEMLGTYLPPYQYNENLGWFVKENGLDAKMMRAWLTVSTRGMNANNGTQWLLVPIIDLINHQSSDEKINIIKYAESGFGFEIRASKFIPAGSELFTRYYGDYTPYLFKEFGFVEEYPQRWSFDLTSGGGKMIDICLTPIDDGSGHFFLEWFHDESLDEISIDILREELARIETMKRDYEIHGNYVPPDENVLIWEYYEALHTAVSKILDAFLLEKDGTSEAIFDGEVLECFQPGVAHDDAHKVTVALLNSSST